MAISEQQIQTVLSTLIDPTTGKDYITSKKVHNIQIDQNNVSLEIVLGYPAKSVIDSIHHQVNEALGSIPGIGKKTAERLIMETKDALSNWESTTPPAKTGDHTTAAYSNQLIQDAVSALITLGYKPNDAKRSVMQIHHADYSSEDMIRLALKQMLAGEK